MDVTFVNPFITSTVETFKTMLKVEARPGKPALKDHCSMTFDVSGIIGLSGEARGSIAICFPKRAALKVVSAMLGMEITIIGEEVSDGIGEIANIVAGHAKQYLHQYNVTISLPKIITGPGHSLSDAKHGPAIVIPFATDLGDFAVEVALETGRPK